jgi:hypothetical protein
LEKSSRLLRAHSTPHLEVRPELRESPLKVGIAVSTAEVLARPTVPVGIKEKLPDFSVERWKDSRLSHSG